MSEKPFVYADNAATTAVSEEVLQAMLPFYKTHYGNPSSVYSVGRTAKTALEDARAEIAACLGANTNEIYFTGCGTESDNWAIKGAAKMLQKKGKTHIITSAFEHHAVLHPVQALEKEGFTVTYLDVHEDGIVRPEELEAAITENTGLVTIMYANNEIGTIQPIGQLGKICREHGILFHTDAVQAAGQVPIHVKDQAIDMLSISAHKLHGPKGVGVLYLRTGVRIENLLEGGAQERGRRGGTENVAGAVGLATALKNACATMEARGKRLCALRDRLVTGILKIDRSRLNGDAVQRLPGNVSFCFEGIEGESLLLMLDMKGICGSSGSACTSGSLDPSHVLLALGLPHAIAHGSLRLSFGDDTTEEEIDYILETVPPIVRRLREMSPLWDSILREAGEK